MLKKILTDEKFLNVVSEDIDIDSPLLDIVLDDIMDTAESHRDSDMGCAGLAANQIGYLFRICVVKIGQWYEPIINPKILKKGGRVTSQKESCLSRPNKPPVNKMRFQRVTIAYVDQNKEPQKRTFHNFEARILQHEMDHFDGRLI